MILDLICFIDHVVFNSGVSLSLKTAAKSHHTKSLSTLDKYKEKPSQTATLVSFQSV